MGSEPQQQRDEPASEFEQLGPDQPMSLVQEFFVFIMENKAWWLVPILLVFGIVGAFVLLSSTGAAPFIYTMF